MLTIPFKFSFNFRNFVTRGNSRLRVGFLTNKNKRNLFMSA